MDKRIKKMSMFPPYGAVEPFKRNGSLEYRPTRTIHIDGVVTEISLSVTERQVWHDSIT